MEVVVMWQWVSSHVDAGFFALKTRVAVVADCLNLLIHPANAIVHSYRQYCHLERKYLVSLYYNPLSP